MAMMLKCVMSESKQNWSCIKKFETVIWNALSAMLPHWLLWSFTYIKLSYQSPWFIRSKHMIATKKNFWNIHMLGQVSHSKLYATCFVGNDSKFEKCIYTAINRQQKRATDTRIFYWLLETHQHFCCCKIHITFNLWRISVLIKCTRSRSLPEAVSYASVELRKVLISHKQMTRISINLSRKSHKKR